MTKSVSTDFTPAIQTMRSSDTSPMDSKHVDLIIAGLDYDSFELLPGTVNPRPGMRYIEAMMSDHNQVATEEPLQFTPEDIGVDETGTSLAYLLPSPFWQPYLMDNHYDMGKKKKKNKKKRNKNRQRQLQLQLQLEQDMSPSSSPYVSDTSADSPLSSPSKNKVDMTPEKKAKKKRNKQRRRGSGRGRRLIYPNYEGVDLMSVHLNGLNFGNGM